MIKNYCVVGTGSRGISMWAKPLVNEYQTTARLTGICDNNLGRLMFAKTELGEQIQTFTDFDKMLDSVPCDSVIVTTKDSLHDEFIIRALKRGKDVITEKPMTIDAKKCRAILAAEIETGRTVRVTFNARYVPHRTKIKELLHEGIIGEIHSVEFHWYLDTVHGADYFRRWHRKKENSGGLLVHKATHHFDLINWWLGMDPVEVAAMGSRQYYVPNRKPGHGQRCLTCNVKDNCEFYLDVSVTEFKSLYLQNENYDGYYRDQCVYSEDTDIEDSMSLIVRYENNVQMVYSLTAATSFEGWRVAFNGSKGRLEAFEPEAFIAEKNQTDLGIRRQGTIRRRLNWESTPYTGADMDSYCIRFYPLFGGGETFKIPIENGMHGGATKDCGTICFSQTCRIL
ncbi:Gfo/Idh/MocA family protein [Alicyclobacillus fastidiosus]|uniref:Gfo/Idh/MocA family protein n=1 Tax=Alicyclobacillus fastidiosus TaxID=392011 RepID=UPI0024E0524B|nr:Gfo/Idh/MocA family oxidoreductase [Alicyclobacillus fastidiosus]